MGMHRRASTKSASNLKNVIDINLQTGFFFIYRRGRRERRVRDEREIDAGLLFSFNHGRKSSHDI